MSSDSYPRVRCEHCGKRIPDMPYCPKCTVRRVDAGVQPNRCDACGTRLSDGDSCPNCSDGDASTPGADTPTSDGDRTPSFETCDNCGVSVRPEQPYCGKCGEPVASDAEPTALLLDGPESERPIRVTDGETVGMEVRKRAYQYGLSEARTLRISREHARFERRPGGFVVTHVGRNELHVNGSRLDTGSSTRIGDGDSITYAGVIRMTVREV